MDESKMNDSIHKQFEQFKKDVSQRLLANHSHQSILDFITPYNLTPLSSADYMKKKRVKNPIPFHEKCLAKRANSEQCSRRKKDESEYCGTHSKTRPHGIVTVKDDTTPDGKPQIVKKEIEVWLEDINGIQYWINDSGVVYDHADIKENKENPRIIAHYKTTDIAGNEVYQLI